MEHKIIKLNPYIFSIEVQNSIYLIKNLETNKSIQINKNVHSTVVIANLCKSQLKIQRLLSDALSIQNYNLVYRDIVEAIKQTFIKVVPVKPLKVKQYYKVFEIPQNINVFIEANKLTIQNKEKLSNSLTIIVYNFFDYIILNNQLHITIKEFYKNYEMSRALFNTMMTKLTHQIKGVSELYHGVINIQGLGYSVAVTKLQNNKYNLFFRFGFKDKFNYIMPTNITIENPETAKTKLLINTYSLELLKQTQLNIQRFRYPKAYKLQGIYLNNTYPPVKKFVK